MPIEQDIDAALGEFFARFTPQIGGSSHQEELQKTAYVRSEMIEWLARQLTTGYALDIISGNAIVPFGVLYLQKKGAYPQTSGFYLTDSDPHARHLAAINCEKLGIPAEKAMFIDVEFDNPNWPRILTPHIKHPLNAVTMIDCHDFIIGPTNFFYKLKNFAPRLLVAQNTGIPFCMEDEIRANYPSVEKLHFPFGSYDIGFISARL